MRPERAHRQNVVLKHNPSWIEAGQTLQICFPNWVRTTLSRLVVSFVNFALNLKGKKDDARTVVPNIGRKIIKTFKIYFEGRG